MPLCYNRLLQADETHSRAHPRIPPVGVAIALANAVANDDRGDDLTLRNCHVAPRAMWQFLRSDAFISGPCVFIIGAPALGFAGWLAQLRPKSRQDPTILVHDVASAYSEVATGIRRARRRCMMQPMPRVPPFDRPATYDDLMKVPDIMVAEIVDGELHASPRPAYPHTRAASSLGMLLGPPFDLGRGGPGGWTILLEPEVHLHPDVVVPDWAGWRRERFPDHIETAYHTVVPDWVCEVVSPSTARLDRTKKLKIYAREGVRHAWLIDPVTALLEVLVLAEGRWVIAGSYSGDDVVRAEPFGDIELRLVDLWAK